MHPLIAAHIRLRGLKDLAIRAWSPYYPMWLRMIDAESDFIAELQAHGR